MYSRMALIFGATLRLTRFVTTDDLGDWLIARPAQRWSDRHEAASRRARRVTLEKLREEYAPLDIEMEDFLREREETLHSDEPISWQARLTSGLDCPYCVGYWIGTGVVLLDLSLRNRPRLYRLWQVIAGTLGLNYVVGLVEGKVNG